MPTGEVSSMSDMMTPEQVAGYLQLTKDTVYRLIRRRKLAATRIGRTYRVPREDLEAFIAANSTRGEVRQALFRRVMGIAARNLELDADAVLDDLERGDGEEGPAKKA